MKTLKLVEKLADFPKILRPQSITARNPSVTSSQACQQRYNPVFILALCHLLRTLYLASYVVPCFTLALNTVQCCTGRLLSIDPILQCCCRNCANPIWILNITWYAGFRQNIDWKKPGLKYFETTTPWVLDWKWPLLPNFDTWLSGVSIRNDFFGSKERGIRCKSWRRSKKNNFMLANQTIKQPRMPNFCFGTRKDVRVMDLQFSTQISPATEVFRMFRATKTRGI